MAMDPVHTIHPGLEVHTADGEKLGTVKDVESDAIKVNASMQPDYWLPRERVLSFTNERVTMDFNHVDLFRYQHRHEAGTDIPHEAMAMEFQEVLRRRRMVRNFESRPLPPELVERILANAVRGPSAGFSQGFEFLVLEGKEQTERFWTVTSAERGWEQAGWPGVYNAPLIVVPLAHKQAYLDRYAEADKGWTDRAESRWPVPYWHIDTGFAALLVLLTAVDCGLGALFFGLTDPAGFREEYGIPDAYDPIGVIAIGYAAPDKLSGSLKRGHRPMPDVVHRGGW